MTIVMFLIIRIYWLRTKMNRGYICTMNTINTIILLLLLGLFACSTEAINPDPETDNQANGAESNQDMYLPYLGVWQGIRVDLVNRSFVANDTIMDLFLKRVTPADIRTFGTIRKGPDGFEELTAFQYPTLIWEIDFDVIPNQLIIRELPDNRLWRFYDIVQFEADTLRLKNQERHEFWCRY